MKNKLQVQTHRSVDEQANEWVGNDLINDGNIANEIPSKCRIIWYNPQKKMNLIFT